MDATDRTPYAITKLTDCHWMNLYEMTYQRKGKPRRWTLCSRKGHPVADAAVADIVLIVPIVQTADGPRLVMTREFRAAIWDWEYGFPTGLIDKGETTDQAARRELKEETGLTVTRMVYVSPPVYSSAGLTDESGAMVLVEAEGTLSSIHNEVHEEIEPMLFDVPQIRQLLGSSNKIAAKAWGLLYHFAATGTIAFSPHGL